MHDIARYKKELRCEVRRRLAMLSRDERLSSSQAIFRAVAADADFLSAHTVALFCSLDDEPQTRDFLNEWHGRKRLLLPRTADGEMEFCDYVPDMMRRGAYGISEPVGCVTCPPEEIDFMIVPGVAFTRDGRRMGRGGGYYDRYMSRSGFRACTAGVCFGVQVEPTLPCGPHDRPVDKLFVG